MTQDSNSPIDKLSIPYLRAEFSITNQQIGEAIGKTKSAINERSRKKRPLSLDEGLKLSSYLKNYPDSWNSSLQDFDVYLYDLFISYRRD